MRLGANPDECCEDATIVATCLGLHFMKAQIKELLADSTASSLDGKVRMMFASHVLFRYV